MAAPTVMAPPNTSGHDDAALPADTGAATSGSTGAVVAGAIDEGSGTSVVVTVHSSYCGRASLIVVSTGRFSETVPLRD